MNELLDGLIHFWEILTGVFNDDRSKLLRITSFAVLIIGCVWAGFNYIKAAKISDLNEDIESSLLSENVRSRNKAIDKLIADARTVGTMRRGGRSIANAIDKIHTSPFNIDEVGLGIEEITPSVTPDTVPEVVSEESVTEPQEIRRALTIKALMLSGKTRYAVVDYEGAKGKVIRQGQTLPGGGRVIRITQESITVREGGRDIIYPIQ